MTSTPTRFRDWFWRPPRAHGEIDPERSVSFLELFYDLVYVVVIAQAARRLAGDISAGGAVEFIVVFGMIWLAWLNGTLYYELHGREDGRTRTFVFLQMAILALLAVFTADAAGADGAAFAVVYAAYLLVLTWLWYTVRRQDRPEYMAASARYLVGMIVSFVVVAASVFVAPGLRLVAWGGLVACGSPSPRTSAGGRASGPRSASSRRTPWSNASISSRSSSWARS